MATRPPRHRHAATAAAGERQLDDLHDGDHADEDHALAADVVGGRGEHAEHDELGGVGARSAAAPALIRSIHQMNTATAAACGYSDSSWSVWASSAGAVADDRGDGERQQPPGPAADDAVDEHEPDAERGHLDQLQPVVVEPHRWTNGDSRSGQPHG